MYIEQKKLRATVSFGSHVSDAFKKKSKCQGPIITLHQMITVSLRHLPICISPQNYWQQLLNGLFFRVQYKKINYHVTMVYNFIKCTIHAYFDLLIDNFPCLKLRISVPKSHFQFQRSISIA